MIITKETKERFVKMLKAGQIIVIQCNKSSNRKTYDYKFIGANNSGKWDFTHLVAEYSNYPNNKGCQYLAIRSLDGAAVICSTLYELKKEGIKTGLGDGYSQYEKIRDLLTTFYL